MNAQINRHSSFWASQPKKKPSYFADAFVDAFAPLLTYAVLHFFGVPALAALVVGNLIAVATTLVHTIRRKRLDAVGLLVIVEIGISIVLQVITRDARLLLIKPSLYSLAGACYLMYTALGDRPLTYDSARPMATQGDPVRTAAYERAWQASSAFRALHQAATLGWAAAFLADAVLRIVIVYSAPVARAVWLGNIPHIAVIFVLVAFSALVGRNAKPFVEEQVNLLRAAGETGVVLSPCVRS